MTDKSIVPFQALQHFRVYSCFMFIDATFFRRASDTLISLDIGLHRRFVDIFRKYKIYSQGAYPNIIHVSALRKDLNRFALSVVEFAEAAFGLVSHATQSLTINGYISYQDIINAMHTFPYLENIQILYLNAKMSLLEVLDVLKHFPSMTDFGRHFQGIGSELAAIQDKLIPSHIGAQYSQLNIRLKF